MSINLNKGDTINLSKDSSLKQVIVAAGWDVASATRKNPTKETGLMSKLIGLFWLSGNEPDEPTLRPIDLDLGLIAFNSKQEHQIVNFASKYLPDGSIWHSGDNRTGKGEGDDETITIDLEKTKDVDLFLVLNSYSGQSFMSVNSAYCRVVDSTTNREILRYDVSNLGNIKSLIIGKLSVVNGRWSFTAIGQDGGNYQTAKGMVETTRSMIH
jgi:tellurium resistance protein TerZ